MPRIMWRTDEDTLYGLFQTSYLNRPNPFYVPVPLVSVHVNVEVVNFCGKVEVRHKFVNKETNPIECIYFFPVEEEAAVVEFVARLQGREIKTVVKEKQEAGQDYNQAVANRQTAFLLEETKPDIFEMKVGYLGAGEVATLTVTYLTELPVEEGNTKVTIPTTVAPRYIPKQVDDPLVAKKIADIEHDLATPAGITMDLAVLMRTEIISIDSSTHRLKTPIKKTVGEFFQADTTFVGHVADMNRDMVIFINSEEPNKPTVIVEKNGEGSVAAMLSFVPQFKLKDHKIEAVFLVDCSGSMQGDSMELAKEALQVFIHSLPAGSFFNIVRFGSRFDYLFSHSKPYDDNSLREAKMFIQQMWANLGGTEIYQPLELILRMDSMAGNPRQVFVLTDGQVSNSSSCIDLVKKLSNTNRVFTLGVGASADRHLVKGLARAGRGTALFTTQGESITAKVINQLRNGLQPCITDLSVKWGNIQTEIQQDNGPVNIETEKTLFGYGKPKMAERMNHFSLKHQAPEKIPPIYDGSRLLVYKLLDESIGANDVITIQAKTPEGDLKLEVPVVKESFINGDSVHKLFARKMIQYIEENHGEKCVEESKKFISQMALKFQVASKHTSFVGVDQTHREAGNFVIKRQVMNQLPQNLSTGFGASAFGGLFGGSTQPSVFGGSTQPFAFGGSTQPSAFASSTQPSQFTFGSSVKMPPGQPSAPTFCGFGSSVQSNAAASVQFAAPTFGGFGSSVQLDGAAVGSQQQSFSFGATSSAGSAPLSLLNDVAQSNEDYDVFGEHKRPTIESRESDYQKARRNNMQISPVRVDFFADGGKTPEVGGRGYAQIMKEQANKTTEPDYRKQMAESFSFGATSSAGSSLFGSSASSTLSGGFKGVGSSAYKPPTSLSVSFYQSADGSFPAEEGLAKELGINLQALLEEGKMVSSSNNQNYVSTWVTAVVVCYLKAKFPKEKDMWGLIVDKAEKWLRVNGVGFVSVYEEKARQFVNSQLKQNGEKNATCPSGHPMVEVKFTDGKPWFCDSKQECLGGYNDGGGHGGVAVWRCTEDWRIKAGGACDFDICGPCMDKK